MPKTQNPTTEKPLACGGKGPCCHIGYAHRHCEHCDVVISLHQCSTTWSLPYNPPRLYPWYSSGGSLADLATTKAVPLTFDAINSTHNPLTSAATVNNTPTVTHLCEVPGA